MTPLPPDILDELRKEYLDSAPNLIDQIKVALKNGDWESIEKHFHRFAGSGKTYGLPEITTIGRGIETYLQKTQNGFSPALLAQAISLFEKVVESYQKGTSLSESDPFMTEILKKIS